MFIAFTLIHECQTSCYQKLWKLFPKKQTLIQMHSNTSFTICLTLHIEQILNTNIIIIIIIKTFHNAPALKPYQEKVQIETLQHYEMSLYFKYSYLVKRDSTKQFRQHVCPLLYHGHRKSDWFLATALSCWPVQYCSLCCYNHGALLGKTLKLMTIWDDPILVSTVC